MKRAFVLCPEAPYPLYGGGPLRTASLLHYLARTHHVDLGLFAVEGASDPAGFLPPGLVREYVRLPLPAHSRAAAARVWRNGWRLLRGRPPLLDRFSGRESELERWLAGRDYDLGIIEHFWCAPYAEILRRHCRLLALDLHNLESEWHARIASSSSWPLSMGHARFAAAYRDRERRLLPRFDRVLVTSQREAARVPHPGVLVYPNAIPAVPVPLAAKDHSIAFSGNFEYEPNRQAVRFFAREIWPTLRTRFPDLRWRLIGRNPQAVAAWVREDSRIECTGPLADAVSTLARSEIAVIPVLAGSGTRVKLLEAWAAQLPVVATSIGAEGLNAVHEHHYLAADTAAAFTASLVRLLESPPLRAQLGSNGRVLYEQKYTWDAAWDALRLYRFPDF